MSGIGIFFDAWEFEQRFSTEAGCIEYLRRQRLADGFRCPRCGGGRAGLCGGGRGPVREHAVIQVSSPPPSSMARASRSCSGSASSASSRQQERLLGGDVFRQHGLKYETAWTWLHKLRSCLSQFGRAPLDGTVRWTRPTSAGGRRLS